jgi:hypothetical protein
MNKVLKISACIFFGTVMIACEGKYKKKHGKMYYSYWASAGNQVEYEVEGADLKSFKVLESLPVKIYAADKNHVYWRGRVIENADGATFRPLNREYSVDGKHIFNGAKVLSTSDPQTFRILEDEYVLDCDSVYFQGKVISGADSKTFTTIGHYYGKDKNAVYNSGRISSEISDPETFRLLAAPEKKGKGWPGFFDDADYQYLWGCDKDYYYREGRKIDSADYSTFTLLDDGYGHYARDRYHVFYCGFPHSFIVEGADVATFEVLNKYMDIAKDRNNYYEDGKTVSYEYLVEKRRLPKQ